MIFFGTLGGIFLFGVPGIIIGPIIAALFVTIWDIYGLAFKDILPEVLSMRLKQDKAQDDKEELPESDE